MRRNPGQSRYLSREKQLWNVRRANVPKLQLLHVVGLETEEGNQAGAVILDLEETYRR